MLERKRRFFSVRQLNGSSSKIDAFLSGQSVISMFQYSEELG